VTAGRLHEPKPTLPPQLANGLGGDSTQQRASCGSVMQARLRERKLHHHPLPPLAKNGGSSADAVEGEVTHGLGST
jgi:hypothetical protein